MSRRPPPRESDSLAFHGPNLSPEDLALWRLVTREVTPWRPANAAPPDQTLLVEPKAPPAPNPSTSKQAKPPSANPAKPAPPAPAPLPMIGALHQMDRRQADRLRRGRLALDGSIDLHGHHLIAAHQHLNRFIGLAVARGWRSLLIITGKGKQNDGLIRKALPDWLRDGPYASQILGLTRAQPHDGGDGAFYLLLRRDRGAGGRG